MPTLIKSFFCWYKFNVIYLVFKPHFFTCRDLIKHTTKIYITNAHSNDSNAAIFVLKTLQLSIFDKTLFNSKRIFSLKRKFYQKKFRILPFNSLVTGIFLPRHPTKVLFWFKQTACSNYI